MSEPQIRLGDLAFSDRAGIARVALPVSSNFTFVFGASNTGKSFAVKALDFMLGGNRELPDIQERRRYDRLQLALSLSTGERLLIERALAGGDFAVSLDGAPPATWSTRHNKENEENLSNYLLNRLGMAGKELAQDKSGTKKALSFRDIVRLCIVDETSIQSETSPAETGDRTFVPVERNVFKYMLTGEDDAALITQLKPREFSVGRNAQVTLLENMLVEVEAELADSFPDVDELGDELAKMQDELADLERQIAYARESARTKLDAKARLSGDVGRDQQRVSDIAIALENFDQLKRVYDSDVERLASIEESGFLLGLTGDDSCPVCGAPAEAQVHRHALSEIEAARAAAEIEIAKIRMHGVELLATIEDTAAELDRTGARLKANQEALAAVEAEILAGLPKTDDKLRRLSEIIPRRDRINRGIGLSKRKVELEKQIGTLKKQRQQRQPSNFQVGLSTQTANEFAREVGSILQAWGFPGACQTFFDTEGTFDLVIDGKRRRDNGKGVRAITHAAFKIGLMTFCRARGLPHPGFVVLDSPLITYRDPIRSKEGTLSVDEQAIKNSDLAERMLEYLGTLGSLGQVIIFDNIDPPANAATYADIIIFTNNPTEGRQGLL